MSMYNKGKFSSPKTTVVPSKDYDESARTEHDEKLKKQLENAPSAPSHALDGKIGYYDEGGKFVEDTHRIKIKDTHVEVSFNALNERHSRIIAKIMGSIMEYLSGQIQDFTTSVMITDKMIPEVLKFYGQKFEEIQNEIEMGHEKVHKCSVAMNIPSHIFRPSTLKKFVQTTEKFLSGDKTITNYLRYIRATKKKMVKVAKENRFLKEGDKVKKI